MRFTPNNIKKQDFTRAFKGFDVPEVKAYLEKIADAFEELTQENEALKKEAEKTKEELTKFKRLENDLREALVKAQESSSKQVESSKKQAQLLMKEAELRVQQINERGKEQEKEIHQNISLLLEERELIIAKLKTMLRLQEAMLLEPGERLAALSAISSSTELPEKNDIDIQDIAERLI